jgi:hypothetical protein
VANQFTLDVTKIREQARENMSEGPVTPGNEVDKDRQRSSASCPPWTSWQTHTATRQRSSTWRLRAAN